MSASQTEMHTLSVVSVLISGKLTDGCMHSRPLAVKRSEFVNESITLGAGGFRHEVTVNNIQVLPGNPGDPTKSQKIKPKFSQEFRKSTKSQEITNFLGGPGRTGRTRAKLGGPGRTWENLGVWIGLARLRRTGANLDGVTLNKPRVCKPEQRSIRNH